MGWQQVGEGRTGTVKAQFVGGRRGWFGGEGFQGIVEGSGADRQVVEVNGGAVEGNGGQSRSAAGRSGGLPCPLFLSFTVKAHSIVYFVFYTLYLRITKKTALKYLKMTILLSSSSLTMSAT
jgi:hypothetical protein